ncbi:ATP-binding cassette domain-containing protein [Nocardioidaceae bacterium SCSIO 66511]|nr:ATP-binding cassette domain-containing protein [Nocardioidaceae bacterium SCSIO 66511]
MLVEVNKVSVEGPHGPLLRPTSLSFGSKDAALVVGPPGAGHTALALAVSGRLRPTSGQVTADGDRSLAHLRRRIAPVDVAGVSEPDEVVPFAAVIGEELAMCGRRASRSAVRAYLTERGADDFIDTRVENVPPDIRAWLLTDLAMQRSGVEGVVIACPDRYGLRAEVAWEIALWAAEAGSAVLLQLMQNTADAIAVEPTVIGDVSLGGVR